jgi:hypothetical protein
MNELILSNLPEEAQPQTRRWKRRPGIAAYEQPPAQKQKFAGRRTLRFPLKIPMRKPSRNKTA